MVKPKCQRNVKFQILKDYSLNFGINLAFAMNHVRFMISPELYVVQETLTFVIHF